MEAMTRFETASWREAILIRGLMRDAEWAFFKPSVTTRTGRPSEHRRTLNGICWVTRTGTPWRDLPEELGEWNTIYRRFRRWSLSALWDVLLDFTGEASLSKLFEESFYVSLVVAPKGIDTFCSAEVRGIVRGCGGPDSLAATTSGNR